MRSMFLAALILGVPIRFLSAADAAPAPASTRKIQKLVIVNLAWDPARGAEVEAGIKEKLVRKGFYADSLRTLTRGKMQPGSVQELVADITSQGYDSLLCVGAGKTMKITPTDHQNDFPTMDTCLSIFLTGKYPSGTSLRSEPFNIEAQPTLITNSNTEVSTTRQPISSNAGAAPVTYYKRTIRVFDVANQSLIWEKKIMVKVPKEMRDSYQSSWIARETAKTLQQSGLLPN